MTDLLLKNVRSPDGRRGRRDPAGPYRGPGENVGLAPEWRALPVEEGGGALLPPGLVEGHAHPDKTTWGSSWYVNDVGSALTDRIDNERDWRAASGHDAHVHSQALGAGLPAAGHDAHPHPCGRGHRRACGT